MLESQGHTLTKTVRIFVTAWRMAAKRSLSRWRLLSTVVLGVLLASSMLAGAVIYFDALRDVALKAALGRESSTDLAITASITRDTISRPDFDLTSSVFHDSVQERVGWTVVDRIGAGKSPTVFVEEPGRDEQDGRSDARSYFAFFPRVFEQEHAMVLPGGSLPREGGTVSPDGVLSLEALVSEEAAAVFGVGVGDRLLVEPTWKDEPTSAEVMIRGLFRVNDESNDVWHLEREVLGAATRGSSRTIPFYVSQETFLGTLGSFFANMDGTYAWLLLVDTDWINSRNADGALEDIRGLHGQLSSTFESYRQTTVLDNTLEDFDRRIFFSRLPMYVVLIAVAVVIVYYVVTISSMVVEERRGEMALLRSRGSSTGQILTVFAMEGAAIAMLAVAIGPFLAAGAISALGYTPSFSELTGGSRLTVYLSPGAFMLSALGGLISFVALIIPAVQASRIGVTRHRQESARPLRLPAFQRYYLDVFLLVVSILLFRQLTEQGSVVATDTLGEARADLLLLALPGLILVAAAMVMLRLFPLAMGLLSRVSSLALPPGLTLGVWQMARHPAHYARLSLLLVLTAGLGIFASSFEATLETNVEERVLYATGSDVRASKVARGPGQAAALSDAPSGQLNPGLDMASAYSVVAGVEGVSPVLRTRGQDSSQARPVNFEMLAVDGQSFEGVAFFRNDFADGSLAGLLESLAVADPPQGLALPADAVSLGVRLKPDRLQPTVALKARLRNANNEHNNITLGLLEHSDWLVLKADLDQATAAGFAASRPLTLVSLYVEEAGFGTTLEPGSLLIDDIRVRTESGQIEIIDGLDDTSNWNVLSSGATALADAVRSSDSVFNSLSGSALLSWSRGIALAPRGIYHGPERTTLPVLANTAFYQDSGYAVGDEVSVVVGLDVSIGGYRIPVTLAGTVDLFPTLTDSDENLLVAEITALSRYANLSTREVGAFPIELWIKASDDPGQRQELVSNLRGIDRYSIGSVQDSERPLAFSRIDPLVEAGWSALLILAFSAVLILSCLGFLVHAYVSFRSRLVQFALTRTVGFSTRQLVAQLWVEQLLVIALGIALGTWMGGRITATIMPFLGHNDWGGQVVPPFVVHVNWGALVIAYAAMFAVFSIICLSLIWLIRRMSLHRVLRLGDR